VPTRPDLTPAPFDPATARITATPFAVTHPSFEYGACYFTSEAALTDYLATDAPEGAQVYDLDRATGHWRERSTPSPAAPPVVHTTSRLYPATSEGEHLVESRGHQLILALSIDTPEGGGTYLVDVTLAPDGAAHLTWSDGVANEHTERHTSLSVALVRLGMLQRCCESNWDRGFNEEPEEFAEAAAAFLDHGTA
jgi:hypothetical protein